MLKLNPTHYISYFRRLIHDTLFKKCFMININHFMAAIKLKWLISFIHSRSSYNWQCIPSFYLNQYGKNLLIFNMNISTLKQLPMVKHKLPLFYQGLLQHWFSFKNLHRKMPHNFREIRMQVLWGNQFIKLSGQNKTLIFHN